jgi:hypothetical protein
MRSFRNIVCLAFLCAVGPAASADDRSTISTSVDVLAKTVERVAFKRTPLEDALEKLAHLADINIVVDWPALRAAKIAGDVPITLSLQKVRLSIVLDYVLAQARRPDSRLTWDVRDGTLYVSTEAALARLIDVRVYDCADLLNPAADPRHVQAVEEAVARLWKKHFAVFAPPWLGLPPYKVPPGPKREADAILSELRDALGGRRLGEVADAIRCTVDPQSWRSHGGHAGSIGIVGNSLVIRQTLKNHEAIARLLGQLRDSRSATPDRSK